MCSSDLLAEARNTIRNAGKAVESLDPAITELKNTLEQLRQGLPGVPSVIVRMGWKFALIFLATFTASLLIWRLLGF